jgi:hypothetical protein
MALRDVSIRIDTCTSAKTVYSVRGEFADVAQSVYDLAQDATAFDTSSLACMNKGNVRRRPSS